MAEELSPESKLYVKEEIEKARKEVKEDLEKAQSRATKTFSTVAMVVGLVTGFGVYFSINNAINTKLKEGGLTQLLENAQDSNDTIDKIKTRAENSLPVLLNMTINNKDQAAKNLSMLLKQVSFKQDAAKGYAWVGDILFQWGTVPNSDDNRSYDFPIPFPNECFSVVPNVKRKGGNSGAIHIYVWSNKNFNIDRGNDIDGWFNINYIAVGR